MPESQNPRAKANAKADKLLRILGGRTSPESPSCHAEALDITLKTIGEKPLVEEGSLRPDEKGDQPDENRMERLRRKMAKAIVDGDMDGDEGVYKLILCYGADPNVEIGSSKFTPLNYCLEHYDEEPYRGLFDFLLSQPGIEVDKTSEHNYNTLLMLSIYETEIDAFTKLIEHGADVNFTCSAEEEKTPLASILFSMDEENTVEDKDFAKVALKLLLEHPKIEVDKAFMYYDDKGGYYKATALMYAKEHLGRDVAEQLEEAGAVENYSEEVYSPLYMSWSNGQWGISDQLAKNLEPVYMLCDLEFLPRDVSASDMPQENAEKALAGIYNEFVRRDSDRSVEGFAMEHKRNLCKIGKAFQDNGLQIPNGLNERIKEMLPKPQRPLSQSGPAAIVAAGTGASRDGRSR